MGGNAGGSGAAAPGADLPQTGAPDTDASVSTAGGDSLASAGPAELPRTGVDLGALPPLGLLLTIGGGLVLLLGRGPRPVGRHVRPAR